MTYRIRHIVVLILAALLPAIAVSQDEAGRKFVKIVHSVDGTMAVDSAGEVWFYDNESGEFVHSEQYEEIRSERSDWREGEELEPIGTDIILPPEERCCDIRYGDVTDFLDDIVIGIDERVEGSVIGGRDVVVKGLVTGSIVCFQTVTVTRTGEVRGDVIARDIRKQPGGRILGTRKEVPLPRLPGVGFGPHIGIMPPIATLFITGFLIFLCVIVIAILPKPLMRVKSKVESEIVKSFFWGILVWLLLLPVLVLLIITIVGIPIAIFVYPLAIIAMLVLGYTAAAVFIGEKLAPAIGWTDKSIYLKAIAGVVVLESLRTLAVIFSMIGAHPLTGFLLAMSIIVYAVVLTVGVGAVAATRFGIRPKEKGIREGITHTPPPPTTPVAPPVSPPPPPPTEPSRSNDPVIPPPPPDSTPPSDSKNATDRL